MTEELLTVENLAVHFPLGKGRVVKAVDGVSFGIGKGETLGLVGESGCGKSTTGRAVLRLIPASGGRVTFDGRDVFSIGNSADLRGLRKRMQNAVAYSFTDARCCGGPTS